MQGLYIFRRRQTHESVPFFKKVIELDPKFAKAWAILAAANAMGTAMPEAEATINKALELNPNLAEAHAVRGFIKMMLDWDWAEAEKSLTRAVALDPNSVEAHHWLGILYQIRGRFPEAKAELHRALELDPTSGNMMSDLGHIYFFAHEFEKAEDLFKKANSFEQDIASGRLHFLYAKQGRELESYQAYLDALGKYANPGQLEPYKKAFETSGAKGFFRFQLSETLDRLASGKTSRMAIANHWHFAAIRYAQLGEKEKAIESLNRALENRQRYEIMNFTFQFFAFDPIFDEIRHEPGFREVLRKMNLPRKQKAAK